MTSNEALEKLGWRLTSYEEDLELKILAEKEIKIVKQDLERLEVLEKNSDKVIKDSVKLINKNLELQQENEKLKKENQILKQNVKDTYETGQEIIYDLTQENEKLKKEKEQIKKWIVDKIKYLDKGIFLMSGERVKGAIEILNELLKEVLNDDK